MKTSVAVSVYSFLIWSGATAFHARRSMQISLSAGDISILYDLYLSTEGSGWNWNTSVSAAPKWSFDQVNQQDPCADDTNLVKGISAWQGVVCDESPDVCYSGGVDCNVIELNLTEYNVCINK